MVVVDLCLNAELHHSRQPLLVEMAIWPGPDGSASFLLFFACHCLSICHAQAKPQVSRAKAGRLI